MKQRRGALCDLEQLQYLNAGLALALIDVSIQRCDPTRICGCKPRRQVPTPQWLFDQWLFDW